MERVDKFITRLNNNISTRKELYMSVVQAYVSTNNFENLKVILEKIQRDNDISIDGSFHLCISRYFVNTNQFEGLFKYYRSVVKTTDGKTRLRPAFIQQLWSCAVNVYPMLAKEITNDLLVTLKGANTANVSLGCTHFYKKMPISIRERSMEEKTLRYLVSTRLILKGLKSSRKKFLTMMYMEQNW